MSKHRIVRLFLASVVAAVAATVLLFVAGGVAIANDVFVMSDPTWSVSVPGPSAG